jgi:phosphopantothenoylcysteine decarboxylase
MNIILAGTGSVAAIKYWRLFDDLSKIGNVKGILTEKGAFFAASAISDNQDLLHIAKSGEIYNESNEWAWKRIGDPIPHIDLKDWADVLVIAPLSANTLTKMAVGICDNLLTSMYYAWPKEKPIIVAPAMNTDMWNNPLTVIGLQLIQVQAPLDCFQLIRSFILLILLNQNLRAV